MNRISTDQFSQSIHAMHGATASLTARERVHEQFEGDTVWEGEVLVFKLSDHPTASRCFAWEVDGEITAVLAEGPIETATDAVRASIWADGAEEPEA
ncbi:MAG: hypothetical protein DRQ54_07470 [Gammaproteobacteria bacterium]|nr:MAG: hypothetical protein DRQ54_07470 [Gammaproteobacteria bacterium]